jgi:Amt family ammonium transporter
VQFDFGRLDTGATAWVLVCAALVLLMTPGVGFLYGGMARTKNVLSVIMQSYVAIALVSVTWMLVAFSLAFGEGTPLIGDLHFVGLSNMDEVVPGFTGDQAMVIPPLLYALFHMMFAAVTLALITGATAERWRFGAFVPFAVLWTILVYAPLAHWVFSPEGWARRIGALDFAGGTVVHANAGAAALAMALVLGPRTTGARPHNLPFALLGAALLWFGWFGFNAGSALQANQVTVYALANTHLAAATAMLAWLLIDAWWIGKPTSLGAASGAVAGLVAITPCSGYVSPIGAIFVGILAGIGCFVAVTAFSRAERVDDAFDVVGLHLFGGIIGSLAVGLFATTTVNSRGRDGLLYGGELRQLGLQVMAVAAVIAYSFTVTWVLGKGLGIILGSRQFHDVFAAFLNLRPRHVSRPASSPDKRNRVNPDQEEQGLDISLHEETAYEWSNGVASPGQKPPAS